MNAFRKDFAQGETCFGWANRVSGTGKIGPLKASMMKYRVMETWTATYADPIRIDAGQQLLLSGENR